MTLIQKEVQNIYIGDARELRSYSKIISMSEQGQAVLTELNNNPADYYNKLKSEGHILSNIGITDTTGQAYQQFNDGTGNYYFMLYLNGVWSLSM